MEDVKLKKVNLKDDTELIRIKEFLKCFHLELEENVDFCLCLEKNGELVGTASKSSEVFKCFAVIPEMQNEGAAAVLVSALYDELFLEGKLHSFVFTKPESSKAFMNLGFHEITETRDAVLLEGGIGSIQESLKSIEKKLSLSKKIERGAVVVNCNPFTLGHKYLIKTAASKVDELIVFVVEEDRSLFSFKERFKLVQEGTKDLYNVKVIPSSRYIISQGTFPSYFLKDKTQKNKVYADLDAEIFGRYFCSHFNISKRFVGEENECAVTNIYNSELRKVLESYNVAVIKIPRKCTKNGIIISASRVRNYIRDKNLEGIEEMVPETTYKFIRSKYEL